MMARVRTNPKRVALFWALSAFLFFKCFSIITPPHLLLLQMLQYHIQNREQDFMIKWLGTWMSMDQLFLDMPANPTVRANVLYLSTEYSLPISNAAKNVLLPYFEKAIWFQNSSLYHFSMFHASHHISPVPATEVGIEAEATSVKSVAESLCPLKIVLDRVVLTSTGVLLGCWQVTSGSDPATIRAKLRNALPKAPEKQLYDSVIFHTSFARLLGPPRVPERDSSKTSDEIQLFHELVTRLNNRIRCFEAVVSELWYVEELDVLALALNARMKVCRFKLGCSKA